MRFLVAVLAVWFAIALLPERPVHATTGERTYTFYPGRCPNDQRWYFIDADDTSVTVGCLDPDYDETQPDN